MQPQTSLRSYVDGAEWVCVFCETHNPLPPGHCHSCGLSFAGGRPRESTGRSLPATLTSPVHPVGEIGIAVALFMLWKLGDIAAGTHTAGAIDRGRDVWTLERGLGLPSEAALQRAVLPHPVALHALDGYYAVAHLGGMLWLALWLFLRHRSRYAGWRNAVVAVTGVSFALQLVSVAPPRLVPGLGVVDTARRYGESVYGSAHFANQVSSLPSVHLAWALLVAAAVCAVGTTRKRWVVLAHPVLTLTAIILTGNHYWLDAVTAVVVTAAVLAVLGRLQARAPGAG